VLWANTLNKVYCANSQDATVTVIDGASNAVVATVRVGDYPDFLCWNPQQNKVYCTRGEGDVLVAIDALADTVLHSVHLSGYPATMAMNHAMNKLYVGCYDNGRIAVLDAGPDTVMRYIPVQQVAPLLWHPTTNRVFCYTDRDADTVKAIDCETDEVVECLPVDNGGYGLGEALRRFEWVIWAWKSMSAGRSNQRQRHGQDFQA
jgi:YVTN family beta-propeller protein